MIINVYRNMLGLGGLSISLSAELEVRARVLWDQEEKRVSNSRKGVY